MKVIEGENIQQQKNDTGQLRMKKLGLHKFDEIGLLIERFLNTKQSHNTRRAYRYDITDFCDYACIIDINDLIIYDIPTIQDTIYEYLEGQKNYESDGDREDDNDKNNGDYENSDETQQTESRKGYVKNTKTINRKAYSLSSFFDYLVKMYGYKQNPLCLYKPLKEMKHSNTESLDRSELLSILEYSKSLIKKSSITTKKIVAVRNYLLLCFLSMSLRRNEAVKIKWRDIQTNQGVLCLRIKQKGGSIKTLPIHQRLIKYLNTYKQLMSHMGGGLYEVRSNDYIFTKLYHQEKGKKNYISADYVYSLIKRMCQKLSITKNITPHSFRKTFIELALNNNENMINIINATGHSSTDLIRYYDTRDVLKNNAVNSVMGGLI